MSMHHHNKKMLALTLGLLLSLLGAIAYADTLEDAQNAYGAGQFEEAVTLLRPLVREENKEAAYLLGRIYEQGDGVAKDAEEAKKLYSIAAKKGHEAAQQRLEIFNAQGGDHSVVVEWYLPAAHDGDTEAQYNLGFMYETGWGVPVNDEDAIRWYREAAEMQHDVAQLRLGMMMIVGEGLPANLKEGVSLIRKSAENGNRIAEAIIQDIYDVGELNEEQSSRIIAGLRRILDEGETKTLETLRRSLRDVEKKNVTIAQPAKTTKPVSSPKSAPIPAEVVTKVRPELEKLVEPVVAAKSTDSAPVADPGKTTTVDAIKAPKSVAMEEPKAKGNMFQFYSEAANRGDADAQYHLGAIYIKGDQVKRDAEEGVYWIKLAAEQGHEMALTYMELWQDDISEGGINSTVAVSWLKEAGREWDQNAIYNLGYLYETGSGVAVNFKKATQWYRFASTEGHAEAKRRLAMMKQGQSISPKGESSFSESISGFSLSPLLISGSLLLIVAIIAGMLYLRRARSITLPTIKHEEKEVFSRASTSPGMETDDRKFFDELWEPKTSTQVTRPTAPVATARESAREEKEVSQNIKKDAPVISPDLSAVERKLAKAVDDLMNVNPEAMVMIKPELATKPTEAQLPVNKSVTEKMDVAQSVSSEARVESKAPEKIEKSPIQDQTTNQKIEDIVSVGTKPGKVVLGAESFLTNGISKDALAASRVSADRLFADGIAIDEAGKAVGRGSYNPQKLNADAMLSMNELSFNPVEGQALKKRKPIGAAASLLPKRSIEDEIEKQVEEIHRSDQTDQKAPLDVSAPLTQDEERSLAEVHFNIGVMFSTGDGVPKNDAQAAKWFLKAAEEGLPEAQFSIGQCYLHGTGLAKNTALGMDWLRKAAANNYEPAIDMLKKRNQAI